MQTKEKIYIGSIVVLSILLFLKNKKKEQQKPCVCPTKATTNYVPVYVPQPIVPVPQLNTAVLEDASVYVGPPKFQVPESTGADKGMLYYIDNNKYYKMTYTTGPTLSTVVPIEITKTEMINAWNLVKPV